MLYELETCNEGESPPCECCGRTTRSAWGLINRNGSTHAAYYVRWTPGHPEHFARFDLICGKWGEGTSAADRFSIMLDCNLVDDNRPFMVLDADPKRTSDLAGRHLRRDEVIGTPLAGEVFGIIDFIWLNDPQVAELHAT